MNLEQKTNVLREIDKTLRELAKLYDNENVFQRTDDANSDCNYWEYNYRNPKNFETKYLFKF